jgi:hypothetical protein
VGLEHLVGGLEHLDYFPFHIWDVTLPIDELIFFKMVESFPLTSSYFSRWLKPPTRHVITPITIGL